MVHSHRIFFFLIASLGTQLNWWWIKFLVYSTYTEITNFLQGFIDNEANLNAASSCTATCSDYRKAYHYHCQSGSLCDRNVNDHDPAKCGGILRDCQEIDESELTICETVN